MIILLKEVLKLLLQGKMISFISLGDRTNIINTIMPDISVSVHCNSRNEWEDFGEKQGTLNLYSYDTPDGFCSKIDRLYGKYRI